MLVSGDVTDAGTRAEWVEFLDVLRSCPDIRSRVLFVPGTILYFWARREQNLQLFTPTELIVFAVTLVAGLIGAYGLLTGLITP